MPHISPDEELGVRLLASISDASGLRAVASCGVPIERFGRYSAMYHYIRQAVEEHGHVPSLEDESEVFLLPEGAKRLGREGFNWLLREWQRLHIIFKVQEVYEDAVRKFGDTPEMVVQEITRQLFDLKLWVGQYCSNTTLSMESRLERYAEYAKTKGSLRGIPTGISHFDDVSCLGWLPGELVSVIARTYMGKTFLLMLFGVIAWEQGKRVLFVSPEMDVEEAEARFDALVYNRRGARISLLDLYRGHYPTQKMRDVAAVASAGSEWITVTSSEHTTLNLSTIVQYVRQYEPDIVLIDGISLLQSSSNRQQVWEAIKEISYGLKAIAVRYRVPILASHQANRGAHNTGKPPGLHEIAYGDAVAQASDRILALSRPQTMEQTLLVHVQKFRRGIPRPEPIEFHFDPDSGDIHERLLGDASGSGNDWRASGTGSRDLNTLSIP